MAFAAIQHQQAEVDRRDKQLEKMIKVQHEQTNRDMMAKVLGGQSVVGDLPQLINENKLSAEQANTLRQVEHSIKQQNENDPDLKRGSATLLAGFTQNITKAKYGMGDLDAVRTEINDAMAAGTMLPTDAQTAFREIDAAQGHQESEEKERRNKAVQHSFKTVMDLLTTSGPMDKYDMVSENAKVAFEQDFWDTLEANPDINPRDLRDKMITRYQPIVAERRKIADEDTQLKFDDAKMQRLVEQKAMSKAAYNEWKQRSETWRNLYKQALEQQQHPLPEPSFLDKMKDFGSSFFQESEAGAAQ
jgi:hypothetical protein